MDLLQMHTNFSNVDFYCLNNFKQETYKLHQFIQPFNSEFIHNVSEFKLFKLNYNKVIMDSKFIKHALKNKF